MLALTVEISQSSLPQQRSRGISSHVFLLLKILICVRIFTVRTSSEAMDPNSHSSIFRHLYPDIVRLYVLDGLTLDELKKDMERREPKLKLEYVTVGQKPIAYSLVFQHPQMENRVESMGYPQK